MTPDEKAAALGIDLQNYQPAPNLAPAVRMGNALYTSGHTSKSFKGRVGADMTIEDGKAAARECATLLLKAAYHVNGTLNNLRVVKLLGAVSVTPDVTDIHIVINGASEVFWDVFGKEERGYHARSALGFAALPTGVAVEVEAIFEIVE